MTTDEANYAIDHGRVWVQMQNKRLWVARRNGVTKTWKTRPNEFRIPVKMGFYGYGEFTHNNYSLDKDGRIIL